MLTSHAVATGDCVLEFNQSAWSTTLIQDEAVLCVMFQSAMKELQGLISPGHLEGVLEQWASLPASVDEIGDQHQAAARCEYWQGSHAGLRGALEVEAVCVSLYGRLVRLIDATRRDTDLV